MDCGVDGGFRFSAPAAGVDHVDDTKKTRYGFPVLDLV